MFICRHRHEIAERRRLHETSIEKSRIPLAKNELQNSCLEKTSLDGSVSSGKESIQSERVDNSVKVTTTL